MKKSALEWFAHLPEPIRSQAVANWETSNYVNKNNPFNSLSSALYTFPWRDYGYWNSIHSRAHLGEFDQPNLHGWISVADRLPTADELVLVIGDCDSDLSGFTEKNQCGLVTWGSVEHSECKDLCYYSQRYTNIKFWQPLPKLPEVKGGGNA